MRRLFWLPVVLSLLCGRALANDVRQPGSYDVGFRVLAAHDAGRGPFVGGATPLHDARPLHIFVWYPAKSGSGHRATLGDYFDALRDGQHAAFGETPATSTGEAILAAHAQGLGGPPEVLQTFVTMRPQVTHAYIDAEAEAGTFPVVLFPEYRAPAGMSETAEYLASHGYIVVSHGLFGAREPQFAAGLVGIETIADDAQFALAETRRVLALADGPIATMGVGIAGSGALTLALRSTSVDAFVSLDSGVPTPFEDGMLKRLGVYDLAAVRFSILAVMSTHESVDPKLWEQYRYAPRHLAVFPSVSEFHMLNFGAWVVSRPDVIGPSQPTTAIGYDWVNRYVLAFLDATLKSDADAGVFLARTPEENGVPAVLVRYSRLSAAPPPPTLAELQSLIETQGVAGLADHVRGLRAVDPEPVSAARFVELGRWLETRDGEEFSNRLALAKLRVELFPTSSRAHYALGQIARQASQPDLSRSHYREALRLLADDPDPEIDVGRRRLLRERAEQALIELG